MRTLRPPISPISHTQKQQYNIRWNKRQVRIVSWICERKYHHDDTKEIKPGKETRKTKCGPLKVKKLTQHELIVKFSLQIFRGTMQGKTIFKRRKTIRTPIYAGVQTTRLMVGWLVLMEKEPKATQQAWEG